MEKLNNNPLLIELNKLKLPERDFAVFGSGPLFVHGLRTSISDLDIVARAKAWEKAAGGALPIEAEMGGKIINLAGGLISIYDSWQPGDWNLDELIDTADVVAKIRFVTLPNVLIWKKRMNRPKDQQDIAILEHYLNQLESQEMI